MRLRAGVGRTTTLFLVVLGFAPLAACGGAVNSSGGSETSGAAGVVVGTTSGGGFVGAGGSVSSIVGTTSGGGLVGAGGSGRGQADAASETPPSLTGANCAVSPFGRSDPDGCDLCPGVPCSQGDTCSDNFQITSNYKSRCSCFEGRMECCLTMDYAAPKCSTNRPCPSELPTDGQPCGPLQVCDYYVRGCQREPAYLNVPSIRTRCIDSHWKAEPFSCVDAGGSPDASSDANALLPDQTSPDGASPD
jgi:hypothetical protein